MQEKKENLSFLDVFSGCGGLSLGLLTAGLKGVFAVEKNPDAFLTLKHNLISPDGANNKFNWPKWLPQKAMETTELLKNHRDDLLSLAGKVDLIAGGPPCQGFSSAGKRNPNDPRNSLTEEYIEIVSLVRPRFLLIENVRGFNTSFIARSNDQIGSKPYSLIVKGKLKNLGYSVYSNMVCCSDFGVPQFRKRFIMIAIKNNDPVLCLIGGENPIDILLRKAQGFMAKKGLPEGKKTSTKDALSDLETSKHELIPHMRSSLGFKQIHYRPSVNLSPYQKLLRQGMNGTAPNSLRLARHTETVVERFKDIHAFARKGRCLTEADREILGIKKHSTTPLHQDMPSVTVTTLPDDILHYSEPRILTVRENARLQSFPDWFEFHGKYTTGGKMRKHECPRYTQVGNAVPPLLSEAIGTMLLELVQNSNG